MEGETRLQAVLVAVVLLLTFLVAVVLLLTFGRWDENAGKQLTFGRWVEGKVYGHNESVRPRVSENGQVSDIGHF